MLLRFTISPFQKTDSGTNLIFFVVIDSRTKCHTSSDQVQPTYYWCKISVRFKAYGSSTPTLL